MKIALFTENYIRGGLDTFIVTLLNNWPEADDEFTLICNEQHPGLEDIRQKLRRPCRIVTHRIATYDGLAARMRENRLLDALRKATKPIVKYMYLARAVRNLWPLLRDSQAERLMVVNGGYPGGDTCRAAGIAWGVYSGKPASIHNFHNLAIPHGRFAGFQEHRTDVLLARHTRAFVTVSHAAARSMAVRPAIPPEKVFHIYNGIALAPGERGGNTLRRELGIADDAPVCLVLGSYEPRKGHRFLLQAFKLVADQVHEAHFVSCGQGTGREVAAVQEMAAELGLEDKVHLLGFRSDAMQLLPQADLLLVGAQEFESFGLTCVEAMARRIPVVATLVGGLPEVVADNEGGFTFERDDVAGFARQVAAFLLDKDLRFEQGNRGYERYMRLFTAQRMATAYAHLLKHES